MKIKDKVIEILKELSGKEQIDSENRLQEDLSLDSLQMVTLLMSIEDEFQIELNESDMNPFDLVTAEDVLCLVRKYCGDNNEEN